MKKTTYLSICTFLLFIGFLSSCDKDDSVREPDDPLKDVLFTIDGPYIYQGVGIDSIPMYNMLDTIHVRDGGNPEGRIRYTLDLPNNFIYLGEGTKGKPYYTIINGKYIYRFEPFGSTYKVDSMYVRSDNSSYSRPINFLWGEVVFNMDGNYIRSGREVSNSIKFTVEGNLIYKGRGTSGDVMFNIDGDYIRLGRKPTGAILFTQSENFLYKGKGTSGDVMFNIDGHFVRKGRVTKAIGEE